MGRGSFIVENTLAKIESEYSAIFQNKIREKDLLEREERALVSIFVAAMLFRTKAFRTNIENFFKEINDFIVKFENLSDKEKEHLASIPMLPPSGPAISGEEFRKMTKNVPTFHSSSIIEMLPEASNIIFNMKWDFLISEEINNCFITSDNPCILMNVPAIKKYGPNAIGSSPGLLQEDIELSLPLSSQIALLTGWRLKNEVYIPVPPKMVNQINIRVMMYAKEKIVACSEKRLEEILSNLNKRK